MLRAKMSAVLTMSAIHRQKKGQKKHAEDKKKVGKRNRVKIKSLRAGHHGVVGKQRYGSTHYQRGH